MTREQIKSVLDRVLTWPESRQEDAVDILLAMEAQELGAYRLSDEERADIRAGLEEAEQGDFATEEDVAAVFDKYRR